MISKVYEWLRAADLNPDDAMVNTRMAAAAELETKIRDPKSYSMLLGAVAASIGGCERIGEQSPTFAAVLECVRKQQPAFPGDLSENGLHLRVLCCIGLGELLASDEDDDGHELMVASLLLSGSGLKPKEPGRHLDVVFDELGQLARAKLQQQAIVLRDRTPLNWTEFDALEAIAGDPPTFNQKIVPAIKDLILGLQRGQRADREELDVMWWIYNGYSDHLKKQLKSVPPHLAAAAVGSEVADRIAPPVTVGVSELVAHAAVRDRNTAQAKPKTIDKIVAELGDQGRKFLIPNADHVKRFVQTTGCLAPLSWLCLRLEESQGAAGWETELLAKTGLTANRELTPSELATQVFIERQAQRVYQNRVKGSP